MDEREFVASRRVTWDRLANLISRASGSGGVRDLGRDEVRELGPLYRRASSDLAYARAHAVSAGLVSRINQLVAGGHALLYRTDSRPWNGFKRFFTHDFPATFRRRLRFFLVAVALLATGAATGYLVLMQSKSNIDLFIPPGSMLRDSVEFWEHGKTSGRIADPQAASMASFLMQNNIKVSFAEYALGILGGVFTAGILFLNGAVLGGLVGYVAYAHQLHNLWPGVFPHGVVELSETCLAGAAGMSLGWALIAPGMYRRKDALVLAARDSVKLVIGGVFLLIFAGFVEAFVSHSLLPKPLKIAFGITSGIALFSYLFLSGRTEDRLSEP